MKIRRLQRRFEDQWLDDAYAYEAEQGKVIFCYNLTWGRMGAYYNGQLQTTGVSIERIETIILPGATLRWLPTERVEGKQGEAYLATLNRACAIPQPQRVDVALLA
ncbi:MAG: hypothetical protein U0350_44485 [Caldilineaceae bacterium]